MTKIIHSIDDDDDDDVIIIPSSKRQATSNTFNLSPQQEAIFKNVIHHQQNVFFTGSAGTGKSYLLKALLKQLRKMYGKESVAVTASTGIAAYSIGGVTLHSFAGVGLATAPNDKLLGMIRGNAKSFNRWKYTRVLVIDEISMVEGDFFDKLEFLASSIKGRPLFGGIQLILCGDYMQLPPVAKDPKFCFESLSWPKVIQNVYELHTVYRQTDHKFIDILNDMRIGIISNETERLLKSLSRMVNYTDGIEPTQLYPLRYQVDQANSKKLASLPGEIITFNSSDSSKNEMELKKINDNCRAPQTLQIKIGAQVMLIKNLNNELVNGSLGKVVGLDGSGIPIVEFPLQSGSIQRTMERETWTIEVPGRDRDLSRTQVPLILSYAMSIHKSQGQTLSRVKVDLGSIFEKGQAYVALSRATSLDSLQVLNFSAKKVNPHPRVIEFQKTLKKLS